MSLAEQVKAAKGDDHDDAARRRRGSMYLAEIKKVWDVEDAPIEEPLLVSEAAPSDVSVVEPAADGPSVDAAARGTNG